MRPIAVIEQPAVIPTALAAAKALASLMGWAPLAGQALERILQHIGAWAPVPASRRPTGEANWPVEAQIPITYGPLPPIA